MLEGSGISRKHCTITFQPDKGHVGIQDFSTNGTYVNRKQIPRLSKRSSKKPAEAWARLCHGDEVTLQRSSSEEEEVGFIVNLLWDL